MSRLPTKNVNYTPILAASRVSCWNAQNVDYPETRPGKGLILPEGHPRFVLERTERRFPGNAAGRGPGDTLVNSHNVPDPSLNRFGIVFQFGPGSVPGL